MSTEVLSSSSAGRKPRIRIAALAVLALLLMGGFAFVQRGRKGAGTAPARGAHKPEVSVSSAPQVSVEHASAGVLNQPIRVTGTLRTDETVTLSTKATGLVNRVYVKEGDRVRRGQLLVEVDDSDIRAQRDRAVAAVAAAQAAVREAEAGARSAEARLKQAKTSRDIKNVAAQSDYRRAEQALSAARTRLSQAQSLAGIAGTEAETRVASAKSSLQAARERLKALQEGSRRQEKAAAEAQVARAQAQVSRMKSMLERREQLLREGAIAVEAVDNARRDYDVALADLNAAREQLSLVREGPRNEELRVGEEAVRQAENALRDAEANRARRQVSDEDVAAAEAQVRQAEAALDAAKAALDQKIWNEDEIRSVEADLAQARSTVRKAREAVNQARADVRYQDQLISQTQIYSPVNGVVTERKVQTGAAVVQMRNELMTLVSSDTLYFEATAPESSLPQLRPGLPAQVMLDAVPGRVFPGTLREIIPVAAGTNRSVRLRISIPKTVQTSAVVGGFARAMIRGSSRGAAVSIPRPAIVSDEGQQAVFIVEGGKARRRPVEVGDPGGVGDRVQVLRGLRGGEQVIVEGASSMTDGQSVTVTGVRNR
jgi:RND family efflux transporter MFP subunit